MNVEVVAVDALAAFARRLTALDSAASVALTGGNSAQQFYDACGRSAPHCHYYWSDERLVPLDNDDSNYKLGFAHLLQPAGVPRANIHPAPVELPPASAAAAYAAVLPRRFTVIVLGLGDDGHTGSLFPSRDPYEDDAARVRAVEPTAAHPHPRLTFTPSCINAADAVWFIVTGEKKRWALDQLVARKLPPRQLPALVADPEQTRITVFHTLNQR